MKDISGKIEPRIVESIRLFDECARSSSIPFFLIGATARDLIFAAVFGIPTLRRTLDIDFAVRVKEWKQYERLTASLLQSGNLQRDRKIAHRFTHTNGTIIDVIPFGDLESSRGVISWPPSGESSMSTIGFEEAFKSSEVVRIVHDSPCDVKVCTPAGLAIMKLIAWDQMKPERSDDAKDLHYILTNYVDAGNGDRLFGSDKDIAESDDFDFSMASPRLLGRDMASIATGNTLEEICRILERETKDDSQLRLAQQMARVPLSRESDLERNIGLLRQLMQGLSEGMASKGR
ncbi:MAG: nucleotidyl transferase AbiEii/AbiGii toxin family protein [Ignavibacteria bacterium]|nr:nucleotidyl transferase AbiEii/AbiGii toxin family protein [Ignavibacteria bacterium]